MSSVSTPRALWPGRGLPLGPAGYCQVQGGGFRVWSLGFGIRDWGLGLRFKAGALYARLFMGGLDRSPEVPQVAAMIFEASLCN